MARLLLLKRIAGTLRLVLALARDPRVPGYAKLLLVATVVYALSPLDFIPDWFPLAGQLDDLALLAGGLAAFLRLCPPDLVDEHKQRLGKAQ